MSVDVLFTGGAVFAGHGEPIVGLAVAVADGRIRAIVPESDAAELIDSETQRVDLAGALLSPSFQDAHVHPVSGGVELLQCDLTGSVDSADAVARIAAYAAANPAGDWIVGAGWSMDHFPGGAPRRGLIDAVVSDRPVLVASRDHHSAWANTAAIERAGLGAGTADPADGRIEREAGGYPAGTFHEGAMELFAAVRPTVDADLAYRGLLRAQDEMLALGITGWQDAMVATGGPGENAIEAYRRAIAEDTLLVHVVGAQWWDREAGLEQIDGMLTRRDANAASGTTDRLDLGTVKIMVDGVAENFTAAMLTPYRDADGCDTDNCGLAFVDAAVLREAVRRLDAAGMQVHFHALGDRAVRDALDAVEFARTENGPDGPRHHLAHLQVVTEADTHRFAAVDAVANLQMLWATHEDQIDTLTLPFMQPGQEARQYPFGDLVRGGARLAGGSDWPVSTADPLAAIHIGVTRKAPGIDAEPLAGANQRLTLETALAAYTSGSAYVNGRDHDTGSIREGYLANLVVIDPDPFRLPADELHRCSVRETWVAGRRVFARHD